MNSSWPDWPYLRQAIVDAINNIKECLREIVRLRAELAGIAGRAKAAISDPPLGKPDHVCLREECQEKS